MIKSFFWVFLLLPLLAVSQSDFDKAEQLFRKGNHTQSQLLFENFLKQNPNHLKTIEYLGDIEGNKQAWDHAIVYYQRLKKIKPNEANYHYKYGGALGMKAKESNKFKALGMIDEVRSAFEKAIVLNPKHLEARWALLEFYLQLPGIIGGSETKATRYANELSKLSAVDGYLAKGHIAEYFGRFKEAEKQYQKAIEVGHSKKTYQVLANLYKNKMNQSDKAKLILDDFDNKKG